MKLFYNIAFDSDKCEVIFLEPGRFPSTYNEILRKARDKIEALQFILDSELRLQYWDDEGTLIYLEMCKKCPGHRF